MQVASRISACVLVALSLFACEGERAERSEAAAVSRAIDGLRVADNAQKAGPLAALRAVPCSVAAVCAVKSECVAAYEKHVGALELVAEAKASVATAPVASVAATLSAAQTGLARAKTLTDDCATHQGELVRTFRVGR